MKMSLYIYIYNGLKSLHDTTISAYLHLSCEVEPRSWRGVLDTTLCDEICQWLVAARWFSPSTPLPPP